MPTTQPFDLAELAEEFEIIGELAGGEAATTYLARRRADGADVQFAVVTAPQGDEGNALSHLAADVNLLMGAAHPGLVPIIGGHWMKQDAFAIVSRRVTGSTLEELLLKRDETFSLPRIAAILSQINGTIAWARDRKVVHRCVTPKTIFIEAGTDRPCLQFSVRPLPLTGMPGVEEDARTIAQLARAMLTRAVAAPERASQPLSELRPGLPEVVLQQTDALLGPAGEAVPDVIGYIGAIAMADALKAGEDHLEKTRNLIEEQRREHQGQLEGERREHDEQLADERAKHQKQVDEQAKRFQKEREEFEHQIAKDNAALAKERALLATERLAHRRDCEALQRERAEHEREITQVREQLEWEVAALATQRDLYANTDEYRTPEPGQRPAVVPDLAARQRGPSWGDRLRTARTGLSWRSTMATIPALLVLIALIAFALNREREGSTSVASETSTVRVVDSVAGGLDPAPVDTAPVDTIPVAEITSAPTVPMDLLTSVAARADSTPQIPWWRRVLRRPAAQPRPEAAAPDSAPKLDTILATTSPPIRPPLDSLLRRDSVRRDSVRRDTSVMRDTLRRRDTLTSRDTLVLSGAK